MKKLILTTVFALVLGAFSFAQTVQKTYYFGTPTVSQLNGYDVISFSDTYNSGVAGEAALPWQMVSLLLPQNTEAKSISVEYSDFVELEGSYTIIPQQKARPLSSTKPVVFEKNEDFYSSEEVYPKNTFTKANTQYLNGCSFAFAHFSPVRYIPATGKVSYAKSVTVSIDVTATKSDKSSKLWMTPEVQGRVERLAQNPEAVQEYKNRARTIGGYELLVITPMEWTPYFDEYVAFYEARGLRTHVMALETILEDFSGRDNAEKVRNYIIQEYENQGIMMVLLGGDSGLVPWRALYCYVDDESVDNLPADMYFVCLDGTWDDDNDGVWGEIGEDDLLPELAIGRMPFNDETQLNNMMHKTLEYQSNPVLGEFNTVILGAEHLGDGYYGSTDLERLIGVSNDYDYTTVGIPEDYDFVRYYETESQVWSGKSFRKVINQNGGQYVHHVGHANTDYVAGWYVTDTGNSSFSQLDGVQHNYGFFHSHGCICGDFTHTCILERMVNISTGFVATTGNSRYGWYVPWGDGMAAHLHREFVDAYYNDRLPYIGTAFVEMKIMTAPYVNIMAEGEDAALRWNIYDINILGDVAVCPWLDEPFRPEVNYEAALAQGTTTTPVVVKQRGVAQSNFRCSIFHDGQLLAYSMTDENGYANLEFADGLNIADTLTLIVTGPNAWPQTLKIVGLTGNTAFVYPYDIDNHGEFNFGRDVSMDVSFKNAGTVDAQNVTATLSTDSEYVVFDKATVGIGNINAAESVTINDAFAFTIANNVPDDAYIDFVMTCTNGIDVWKHNILYRAAAPVLKIKELSYAEIVGDMNGLLDPGETVKIVVKGRNVGHYNAETPCIHGNTNSDYITFLTNDLYLNELNVGDSFEEEIEIYIAENAPDGTAITFDVSTINGEYIETETISLVVGTVKEDFETGDLSKFNWTTSGDAEWFVTNAVSHTGTYSVQCGHIENNQTSSLLLEISSTYPGELSFFYKTSTWYKKDYLILYIDGRLTDYWSGENDWTYVSYELSAGEHIIEWRYDTAYQGGLEGNVCWLDDIVFPRNAMIVTAEAEYVENDIAVFPNPAHNVLQVRGEDVQYVEIFNSIGTRVFANNVSNSESIDISDFASGIYFVRIFDRKGNISTERIVKR